MPRERLSGRYIGGWGVDLGECSGSFVVFGMGDGTGLFRE